MPSLIFPKLKSWKQLFFLKVSLMCEVILQKNINGSKRREIWSMILHKGWVFKKGRFSFMAEFLWLLRNFMNSIIAYSQLRFLRFPKWGVTSLWVKTVMRYCQAQVQVTPSQNFRDLDLELEAIIAIIV